MFGGERDLGWRVLGPGRDSVSPHGTALPASDVDYRVERIPSFNDRRAADAVRRLSV